MRSSGGARLLMAGVPILATDAAVARWGDLGHRAWLAALTGLAWVAFAGCAWLVLRSRAPRDAAEQRRSLRLVVLLAAVFELPGLFAGQHISNDAYRYVWDGRVQLSGVSPYRYSPLDDHLAHLRDPLLFPGLRPDQRSGVGTIHSLPSDKHQLQVLSGQDTRTRMNHSRVTTIYPPVAEAWFTAVALVTPWTWGTHGLQVGCALLAVAFTYLLGRCLARRREDPRRALLWGWCPTVVIEASIGAHADLLAAVLLGAAVIVITASPPARRWLGGALLGLSVATKLTPALLLPAFTILRRVRGRPRDLQVSASALATAAATYVPHILAAGTLVLGFLPGYLNEEGFDDGHGRYAVLGLLLPADARKPVALALAAALVGLALWRAHPERPQDTAVWLFGGALLIGTPGYPWYCLPLIVLAVLAGRSEWLAVAAAVYPVYALYRVPHLPALAYAAAGLVVLATTLVRARHRAARIGGSPGVSIARPGLPAQCTRTVEARRERMRREPGSSVRRLALAIVAVAVLAGCGTAVGAGTGSSAVAGSTASAAEDSGLVFHATTVTGSPFDASSLRGRAAALWFWAPSCTICRAEAPTVAKVAAAFQGRVTVVGVAGQGTVAQMQGFVQETGTAGIVHLADVRGSIWRQYRVVSQPSFVFVRANGQTDLFVGSLNEATLTMLMTATAHGAAPPATGTATHPGGGLSCNSDGSTLLTTGGSAPTGSLACDSSGPHPTPSSAGSPTDSSTRTP